MTVRVLCLLGAAAGGVLLACTPPPRCTAFLPPVPRGVVVPNVKEASGLTVSHRHPQWLWVHQDSGNQPVLWALDREGRQVATVRVRGVQNVDWEDLAGGPCGEQWCLFVGDIGDNLAVRTDVAVLRFPEPAVSPGDELEVDAERFPFRYPQGPQNAEALVVTPEGVPVVLTKRNDGISRIHRFPALQRDVQVELEHVGDLPVKRVRGWLGTAVTGADLAPEGDLLFVRTYAGMWVFDVAGRDVADWPGAPRWAAPISPEIQGESVAFDAHVPGLWTTSEGPHPVLHFTACAPLP